MKKIVQIEPDCVYENLSSGAEVYCLLNTSDQIWNLTFERINEINKMVKSTAYVFFKIVESEE